MQIGSSLERRVRLLLFGYELVVIHIPSVEYGSRAHSAHKVLHHHARALVQLMRYRASMLSRY